MSYRVGMEVRIDPNLEETCESFYVTNEMLKYRGRVTKIAKIGGIEDDRIIYHLEVDELMYSWDSNWFAPHAINKGRK